MQPNQGQYWMPLQPQFIYQRTNQQPQWHQGSFQQPQWHQGSFQQPPLHPPYQQPFIQEALQFQPMQPFQMTVPLAQAEMPQAPSNQQQTMIQGRFKGQEAPQFQPMQSFRVPLAQAQMSQVPMAQAPSTQQQTMIQGRFKGQKTNRRNNKKWHSKRLQSSMKKPYLPKSFEPSAPTLKHLLEIDVPKQALVIPDATVTSIATLPMTEVSSKAKSTTSKWRFWPW